MDKFYESHPISFTPAMPATPKLTLEEASSILTSEVYCVEITDEMRAEQKRRLRAMQNPRQIQGRTPAEMEERSKAFWVEEAFTMTHPDFHNNPLACAKYFDKKNKHTQMPDVFHTSTGTQFEMKLLNPRYSDFSFYPLLQPQVGEHGAELIDYYLICRGRYTATHYYFKPIYIFPFSMVYLNQRTPTRYITIDHFDKPKIPEKAYMWRVDVEEAVKDGFAMRAEDIGPV